MKDYPRQQSQSRLFFPPDGLVQKQIAKMEGEADSNPENAIEQKFPKTWHSTEIVKTVEKDSYNEA